MLIFILKNEVKSCKRQKCEFKAEKRVLQTQTCYGEPSSEALRGTQLDPAPSQSLAEGEPK